MCGRISTSLLASKALTTVESKNMLLLDKEIALQKEKEVRILYTNYRGETALRVIIPERLYFGSTEWHPEPQWLLEAMDVDKEQSRSFAMKDIRAWIAE